MDRVKGREASRPSRAGLLSCLSGTIMNGRSGVWRSRRVQALEAYQRHMQRPDEEIDLMECSLLISQHAHPMLVRAAPMINTFWAYYQEQVM